MSGVRVNVSGNAAGAINALDQVTRKAESAAQKIVNGFQQRIGQRMFDGLIRAANSLPAAMKAAIDAGGRLSDQMARTGAAGEGLVILERALKNAGMSADATARLLGQMQKSFAGINEEMQTTSEAFASLGLSMETLRTMDPVAAFQEIGRAIMGIQDPAQRTALAMRIFGRAGADALVMFSDRDAIEQARKELGQLPGVLASSAQSLDVVSDRLANMGTAWQQIGAAAAVAILPALESITGKIASMDLTGLGTTIGNLLNLLVDFAPVIIGIGAAMVALKIASIITQLASKTAAWWAQTAAIQANTTALATNAVAARANAGARVGAALPANVGKTLAVGSAGGGRHAAGAAAAGGRMGAGAMAGLAGRGVLALAGGPVGVGIMTVATALGVMNKKVAEAEGLANSMTDAYARNSAALRKFEFDGIKANVTTREEIEETIQAIEAEKKAILDAAKDQAANEQNRGVSRAILADAEKTAKMLEVRAGHIRAITDEQIQANAATQAAAQAELDRAAAVEKAAEAYTKLREEFQKKMDEAGEKADLTGPLNTQLAELDRAEAEIRAKMSKGFGFDGLTGTDILAQMDANSDIQGPERTRDLEQAIKLIELEEKRAEIAAKIKESRAAILADYREEIGILAATVQGEDEKVAALEREAEVRREIARLTAAGFSEPEARVGAENLVNARAAAEAAREAAEAEDLRNQARARGRDILLDAQAAAAGEEAMAERAIARRAAELAEQSGLGIEEATDLAANEASLDKITALRRQMDNPAQFQSTLGAVSSMQRIGGGGGAASSGLDYSRQQTDIQRQIAQELRAISSRIPLPTLEN